MAVPSLPTPAFQLSVEQRESVYEPAEDTFLLLDALERDQNRIRSSKPTIVVEIGCGSGVVSAFAAQAIGYPVLSLATDLNARALECTRQTARMNGVSVETLRTDLLQGLELANRIDLLLFNPPYVPTDETPKHDVELCWAGGPSGRGALDRLLPQVPSLLSSTGLFYVVALHSNDIPGLLKHNAAELHGEVAMERRCGIERLYVLRFEKTHKSNGGIS